MLFTLCCCLAALCQGALSYEYHINSTSGLIEFSKNVNSGTSYSGTTVFLDADIDFSGGLSEQQFEPIGNSEINSFQGVFDGQGHTISNLAIKSSSSQYVGLFGYSWATTIRNVVLGSSCSVVNPYSGSDKAYVGGIIGYCRDCTIENTVSMTSVSFTGSTSKSLYIGGIVGYLSTSSKEAFVRNCANYGSVIHSGTATKADSHVFIGGIVGISDGSSTTNKVYIQNCFNYGTINHNGTTSGALYISGILGCAWSGINNIENCVNGGKNISNDKIKTNYIGSVVGQVSSSGVTITHCYWTSDVGNYNAYGKNKSVVNVDTETKQVSLNTTTVDSLNSYNSSWNKWLLNTNNRSITFNVNNGKGFNISSQLILLPSLAESEKHTFSGWFEDEECIREFTASSIEADKVFYGGWNYVVTFDSAGGVATTSSKSVVYGQKYGTLPSATKTGYTFIGWFTEALDVERITSEDTVNTMSDHTLYAHWTANNYTVTLNVNGGDAILVTVFIVIYDQPYNCLPNATRTGHTFTGWYTEENGGTEITNKTTANITADNHTLYAQWTANNYTITFNFGNGTIINKTYEFNETINYPENLTREGYTFSEWAPKPDKMPANDTTVVAQWIINNYTITFDFGNGTTVNKTLKYNETITYPVNLTKEDCVFNGWEPKPETMPTEDTTVVAQWIEVEAGVESEYVEIVFDRKDMTKDEITEIIKEFTKESFTVKEFWVNENNSLVVIIKFNDETSAKNFVWSVSEGRVPNIIKRVGTVPAEQDSFVQKINAIPMTPLLILLSMYVVHV